MENFGSGEFYDPFQTLREFASGDKIKGFDCRRVEHGEPYLPAKLVAIHFSNSEYLRSSRKAMEQEPSWATEVTAETTRAVVETRAAGNRAP